MSAACPLTGVHDHGRWASDNVPVQSVQPTPAADMLSCLMSRRCLFAAVVPRNVRTSKDTGDLPNSCMDLADTARCTAALKFVGNVAMRRSGLWTTRAQQYCTSRRNPRNSQCVCNCFTPAIVCDCTSTRAYDLLEIPLWRAPRASFVDVTNCFQSRLESTKHRHCGLCPAESIPNLLRARVTGRATHSEKKIALDMVLGSRAVRYRTVDMPDGPESGRWQSVALPSSESPSRLLRIVLLSQVRGAKISQLRVSSVSGCSPHGVERVVRLLFRRQR